MIGAEQLNCREFVELVTAYFEGALSPAEERLFDAHLAACDKCTEYLQQMRQTIRVTGTLSPDDLSPEAEEVLLEAFRGWYRGS
jgi:anti-sigma factor RsiW